MIDPFKVQEWKDDTAAAGARLIVLDELAQDNGLTEEERREYEELKRWTNERFARFLRDTRDD